VTAGHDRTVRIWDVAGRRTQLLIRGHSKNPDGHSDEINWVAFSPDGRKLATASDDRTVKLWSAASGEIRATLGHDNRAVSAVFTPDGRRVISCTRMGAVIVWDAETLQRFDGYLLVRRGTVQSFRRLDSFRVHRNGTMQALAISPDGTTLAIAGERVVIWSLAERKEVTRLAGEHGQVNSVAFSHDGTRLATTGNDGKVNLWKTRSWQPDATFAGHRAYVESVAFAPDDRTLASVDRNGIIHIWDRDSRAMQTIASGQMLLWCAALSPDGRTLVTTGKDVWLKLWDFRDDRDRIPLKVATSSIPKIAFSTDGKTLTVADDKGCVTIFQTQDGHGLTTKRFDADGPVFGTALSPDAALLVTSENDGRFGLWDIASERRIQDFRYEFLKDWHAGDDLAISKGGASISARVPYFVPGGQHSQVAVWDRAGGAPRYLKQHGGRALYSPQGGSVATYGAWGTLVPTLWDLSSGSSRTARGPRHRIGIFGAAFSQDGSTLATGGNEGSIILWNVRSLEPALPPLYGHTDQIEAIAFSPDGRTLASGGHDRLVRLWDVATGTELAALAGHVGVVTQVCFSPDGMTLATCGSSSVGECELLLRPATTRKPAKSR